MSHCLYPKQEVVVRSVDPDGKRITLLTMSRYEVIDLVVDQLRAARENLKAVKAPQARKAVARAMKSVEGARRNAARFGWNREDR